MKGPYGFEVQEEAQSPDFPANSFFGQLPTAVVKDLGAIKFTSAYPGGAVLFIERQPTRGLYVVCEGEVKLSVSSSEGKKLILRITKPGEVLGLVSALTGTPHEVTAETVRPCQVSIYSAGRVLAVPCQTSGDLSGCACSNQRPLPVCL